MGQGLTVATSFSPSPHAFETTVAARSAMAKRAFDVALALVLLLATLPVLVIVALTIRATSGPGVLFAQERIGHAGRRFTMLKFRTMIAGADRLRADLADRNDADGPLFKLRHDPRVTRVGAFLRRTSLDELPQLVNVLRGDMSLVGPRPALPDEVADFPPEAHARHAVRPGITGLWQVSGRSDTTFADYLRHDLDYIRRRSLALDLAILVRTVPAVVRSRGSY